MVLYRTLYVKYIGLLLIPLGIAYLLDEVYNPLSVGSGSEITLLVKKYADSKMGTTLHNLKEAAYIAQHSRALAIAMQPKEGQ